MMQSIRRVEALGCVAAFGLVCGGGVCRAQSLFETPIAPVPERAPEGAPAATPAGPSTELRQVSLYAVEAPKPRQFQANDLITIIISERSKLDRSQKAESDKEYSNEFAVEQFIDLINLLELRIQATSEPRLPRVSLESETSFEGEGKYTREDRLTDRITAKILEVKPNGTMVIEAKRSVQTDEEGSTVTLSGVCRSEDVTDQNTVQSNQLYDLALNVENTGDLDRSSRKGVIPRILETIFNF